jgi:hypothetical protein
MPIWRPSLRPESRAAVRVCALIAVGYTAIALSACGAMPAARLAGAPQSPTPRPAAASPRPPLSPRQRAVADAAQMIASVPRPPGAVRTGLIDSLSVPAEGITYSDLVTATQWWRVPGQPQAVLSWVAAHLPKGFTLGGSGGGDYQPTPSITVPGMSFDQFSLPVIPNVLAQRWLQILVAPDGPGQTAVRLDAQVLWLHAKPAAERIPLDASVVTVSPEGTPGPLRHAVTITNAVTVARIAAVVDDLPVAPTGGVCVPPAYIGLRLTFSVGRRGPVVARVAEAYCAVVTVTIGGRSMPALRDYVNASGQPASSLAQRVMALAGLR